MTQQKRRRMLLSAANLLVVTGLAALVWCGIALVRTRVYQEERAAALDREILFRPINALSNSTLTEGALLGSVSIPRVGVSSVILEGTDDRTLALSVGHIPGTAAPGREGNIALAGHRDTFFRGLQNIRSRDAILLTTLTGTQLYEVESTRVVSPDDVYVLDDIGRPLLTLVTCYPFTYIGSAPKRFIVQAHPVGR
jgi:LPXTG-site transpeptidase (sortase) family protein